MTITALKLFFVLAVFPFVLVSLHLLFRSFLLFPLSSLGSGSIYLRAYFGPSLGRPDRGRDVPQSWIISQLYESKSVLSHLCSLRP